MRRLWGVVGVGVVAFGAFVVASAPITQALGPVDSPTSTQFSPLAPLIITSYRTSADGKDLDVVELYNDGDEPINLGDWSIRDTTNARDLRLTTAHLGLLAPGGHVVAARAGAVLGDSTTYRIDGWKTVASSPAVIAGIVAKRDGYRSTTVAIAAKTIGVLTMRSYNTSSYSTSTFEVAYRSLFDDGLYLAPASIGGVMITEIYPYASDCTPNDTSVLCGDYIKLQNAGNVPVSLDDLVLRTDSSSSSRTSSNTFALTGDLDPGAFYLVWLTDSGARISLTNSGGYVWLEDALGTNLYAPSMTEYEGAGSGEQGLSYALDPDGKWVWTTTPSPNGTNVITAPIEIIAPCPAGKYRNPETNRCRNIEEAINELTACNEGYTRNPLTNRCRKNTSSATSSLTPCREGQVRNPETNRCRSIASEVASLVPCNDGYERNPATNRCKKVLGASVTKAEYPVEPYATSGQGAGIWWGLAGVAAGALGYAVWEWRRELAVFGAGLASRFRLRK